MRTETKRIMIGMIDKSMRCLSLIKDELMLLPEATTEHIEKFRRSDVRDLDLFVRALNVLVYSGIKTVDDLIPLKKTDLLRLRNCGMRTVKEIEALLLDNGLNLDSSRIKRDAILNKNL